MSGTFLKGHPSSIPPSPSTIPPRPSSWSARSSSLPPRPSSVPPIDETTGGAIRFRPARFSAAELTAGVTCRARCDGKPVGPLHVLDLGPTGFAAGLPRTPALPPGTVLEGLELLLDGHSVWAGEAVIVHGGVDRFGARFTSGLLDLRLLRIESTVESRLAMLRAQQDRLPVIWRAAVGDLRQLLQAAKLELDEFERTVPQDPLHRAEEEIALFEGLGRGWGAAYYGAVAALHEQSKSLGVGTFPLAQSYASSALLPLLLACPMHRRAYEKPLGYAGDFRMMELCFTRDLSGDGLFGRFLHYLTQHYSVARTLVAREVVMREAVRGVAESSDERPARILSMAAGPAIEIRELLGEVTSLRRPLELVLLDQDETAHETAHRRLTRLLVEHHNNNLPVKLQCLRFSVRQLLGPRTLEERAIRDVTLANLDLVYSAGLYDYLTEPVARRLTTVLYSRLRPGGRLLVGNLVEAPDSTWVMEYVVGWHLVYRTDESMLRLAAGLKPRPARVAITRDRTGGCLFLDVTSPS
jgi:extracellular factor (EF) 3-hydroxypalmitic acid methyl ester biosynthesis protein